MKCKQCGGPVAIERSCRRLRLRCQQCKKEYFIGELAAELDQETEDALARYNSILYE